MAFDPLGWAQDRLSDIGDAFTDATDTFAANVPGGEWVKDAVNGGLGVVGDIAKTDVGRAFLTVITNAMVGPLAWEVGPQLASALWAVPGVAAGEPFMQAWSQQVIFRAKQCAEMYGGELAKKFIEGIQPALNYLNEKVGPEAQAAGLAALQKLGITPEKIAAEINVRADSAASAINSWLRQDVFPLDKYDPQTGARIVRITQEAFIKNLSDKAQAVRKIDEWKAQMYGKKLQTKETASAVHHNLAAQFFQPAAKPAAKPAAPPKPQYERDVRPEVEAAKNVPWYYYAAGAGVLGGVLYYFLGGKK